jgi:Multiubiquitin
MSEKKPEHDHLHIFVNGTRIADSAKVYRDMSGAQIAALADVPALVAIVRLESGRETREIGLDEIVHIRNGMQFSVIHKEKHDLHIFVNRRKFDKGDGVRPEMTGAQIAALVEVPAENAVVRLESGGDPREISVNETVHIKNGMHFLVTRRTVEGGHEHGKN